MQTMYPPQNNGIRTQVTVSINAASTSIAVEDASVLPEAPNILSLGGGDDTELVKMTAVNGNILVVERGFNDTIAKEWEAGTYIYRGIQAQDVSALQENLVEVNTAVSNHSIDTDNPHQVNCEQIGAADDSHTHGNITTDGKVGSTANLPLFTGTGGVVSVKNATDAKISLNIATWNFGYYGRALPFSWAEIRQLTQAADFKDIRPGDYKDITLSGTFYDSAAAANKTITNAVFREEIAGIDIYYQYGDTAVPHHIDFISRDCLTGNLLYNATATNSGGYIGSALFATLNGANGLQKLLPADVAAVIIQKRGLTETKTGADASSWAWNDMGKLWLPTEREVWGNPTWSEIKYGGGLNMQYPIFRDSLRHVIKGDGHQGGRCSWWCASSVAGSAANFCFVTGYGLPTDASAANAYVRVPLCFRVA